MVDAADMEYPDSDANRRIAEVVGRERRRLLHFIRRRVPDRAEAEDILQDVFAELVEANRLLMPIDHLTGWLFRVARNRIIDLLRRKRPAPLGGPPTYEPGEDDEEAGFEDLLPSPDAGPEALYFRQALLDTIDAAIAELPPGQREVFVWHELEGRSFRDMAAATGISINTLLSRKRYAVRHLRRRLQDVYDALDLT